MGLLDDAIREHLELKRRHGADEGEVSRLESEALGPARTPGARPALREDDAVADPAPDAVADPAPEVAPPDPVADSGPLEFEAAAAKAPPSSTAPAEPPPPRPPAPEPPAADPRPAPVDPEPPHGDELDEVVEPEAPASSFAADEPWLDDADEVPSDERLDHPRGQETREFSVDDHAAARGETGYVAPDAEPADDVLEETPEFLQETPEHDRLWFEQKPPKDFDFGS